MLNENGDILTQYRNVVAGNAMEQGNSATLGIENATGTDGLQYSSGEAVVTAVLTEAEAEAEVVADDHHRTTLTTTLTYPTQDVRDIAARSPMERGVGESYARLDRVLADLEDRTANEGDTSP